MSLLVFKAIKVCYAGGELLQPGAEVWLSSDTPDTPGVLVALNRPQPKPEAVPEPEADKDEDEPIKEESGELAGDPASPPKALTRGEKAAATRAANKAKQTTTE